MDCQREHVEEVYRNMNKDSWCTTYSIVANKLKTGNVISAKIYPSKKWIYDYRLTRNCRRNNKKLIPRGL